MSMSRQWRLAARPVGKIRDSDFDLVEVPVPEPADGQFEAVGHVVLAWIWLQQAVAAHGKAGDFYDGKRLAARYFFHYELPKTTAQFDLLDNGDRTTTDLDENWF
jgi:hypothetical protein